MRFRGHKEFLGRSRASRIRLGVIGLGVLAASTASALTLTPIPIPICLSVSCMTSQLDAYQAQLEAEPQNATADTMFVADAGAGGSFQPSLADLKYFAPTTRNDYSTVPSGILMDGGIIPPPTRITLQLPTPPPNSTWAALEDQAKVNALSASETPSNPYVRNPSYLSDGETINSCQEYVYHSFSDLERWIDATNACAGNANCEVTYSITGNGRQLSYPPEIDRSLLHDSDGSLINTRLATMASEQLIDPTAVNITPPSIFTDALDALLPEGQTSLGAGTMPKNAFYVGTSFFVVPELAPVLATSSITALQNQIAANQYTYAVNLGPTSGAGFTRGNVGGATFTWTLPGTNQTYQSQGFLDEWDYHETMNQRVAGMTNGEAREYASRQQALVNGLQALNTYGAIPWCQFSQNFWEMTGNLNGWIQGCAGLGKVSQTPVAPIYVPPSQVDPDPFATPQTIASSLLSTTSLSPALVTPNLVVASLPQVRKLVVYPGEGVSGPTPTPQVPEGQIVSYAQRAWEVLPPILNDPSDPTQGLNCNPGFNPNWLAQLLPDDALVMKYVWTPVCNVTSVILTEWARANVGAPSCYDDPSSSTPSYRCDWSPQMFVDRFVNSYVSAASNAKDAEYDYCKRWTGTDGGPFASELVTTGPNADQVFASNGNLTAFRALLDGRKKNYDAIMKNVPVAATNTLGTTRLDSARIGNSMFNGAYSYDLGWTANITQKDANGIPCEWGGTLNAEFDANATVMGFTEELVSAGASLSAMPNDTSDTASGTMAAHLRLLDSDVFTPFSTTFGVNGTASSGPVNPTEGGEGVSNEDSISLLGPDGVPIQAGPITITINAGIEYGYSANVTYAVNTSLGCQTVPTFGLQAGINPTANFGVWASADATIIGFGAGVEVQLTLIQVGLPLTANVTMLADQPDPINTSDTAGITAMQTQFDLDLTLSTLSGQLDVYGVVFGFHVFTTPVVTWQGPTWTIPLFHTPTVNIPLKYLLDVSPTATNPQG